MWISGGCLILTLWLVWKKPPRVLQLIGNDKSEQKKYLRIVLLFEVIGLLLSVTSWLGATGERARSLSREAYGEGDYIQEMDLSSSYYTGEIEIEVAEQQFDESKAQECIAQAMAEIDKSFLGDNEDISHICTDVCVEDSYVGGLVDAHWAFDDYSCLSSKGEVDASKITDDTLVEARVTLSCGDLTEIYVFSFCLVPPSIYSKDGILREIRQRIDVQEDTIVLPDEIDDIVLKWKKKESYRGVALSLLGMLLFIILPIARKKEEAQESKHRREQMRRDYPQLVEQLMLFMGAGITLREASGRMVDGYENRRRRTGRRQELFELWSVFYHEVCDGVRMQEALRHFSEASGIKECKKLALLLQQNEAQGSAQTMHMMEQEAQMAIELHRNAARSAGEEASVRLLFPMMGMLGIVIVILIVPALMTMGNM